MVPSSERIKNHRRVSGVAVAALVGGLVSLVPSGATATASVPTRAAPAADDAVPAREVVPLATGDRVVVHRLPGGRTAVSLLPGSPHYGEPVRTVTLAGQLYVRPLGLSQAQARRLDASMFNVTRLAEAAAAGDPAEVRVTFADGTTPHDVPGIDVDPSTARTVGGNGQVARGSYAASDPNDGSWRGVTSVSLPGADASDAEPAAEDYELHTLTVNVRDRQGNPADCAAVVVLNLDDGRLFSWLDFCAVDGRTKLSVPEGNYAIITDVFAGSGLSVAATQRLEVSEDTEHTLSAGEATARVGFPTVPRAKPVEMSFNYLRSSEGPGGFESSYGVGSGFKFWVEPSKPVELGDLRSTVRGTLRIPHAKRPADIVETLDWRRGVPTDLSFEHVRSDFTDVTASYHSDGRRHKGQLAHGVFGFAPGQSSDWASVRPIPSPLKRHELYQGGPKLRWYPFNAIGWNTELDSQARHYRPGKRVSESWFRGPMAPGIGYVVGKPPTGRDCPACRTGDVIRLGLAPFTDAVAHHSGWNWGKNPWALNRGGDVVARGGFPSARIEVPGAKSRYSLTLRHKMPKAYALSTRSSTTWGFKSGTSDRVLPLLVPRYSLPVDLMNRLPSGKASFRLAVPKLGGGKAHVAKPTVKVSYNGGKTWKRAKVVRKGPEVFRVRVMSPKPGAKARYGSLQVRAKDRAGNTVEQTVRRAWRIRAVSVGGGGGPSGDGSPDVGPAVPRHACGAVGDNEFRCLAIVGAYGQKALDARTDPAGYGAHELRDAYNLTSSGDAAQTVAVVVAGDYPTAAKDLNVYRKQYGLPVCTVASGCFTKLNQNGEEGNYPRPDRGWALEAALDLQMVSASCPSCKVVLVEANTPYFGPMTKAVDTAAAVADVVSHSYGAYEFNGVEKLAAHYDVDGVPMTVSAGNSGYEPANFPASVPSVISVGGTALRHADNDRGWKENAWQYGGSGCSAYFGKPEWQTDPACHMRTIADVAAIAAPNTGVAVYDSFGYSGQKGWFVLGGTSTAAPLVAGMIAVAGDADGFDGADLYAHAGTDALYDVVTGTNRTYFDCKGSYICTGKPGYDAPTGVGTPNGLEAFTDVAP